MLGTCMAGQERQGLQGRAWLQEEELVQQEEVPLLQLTLLLVVLQAGQWVAQLGVVSWPLPPLPQALPVLQVE